MTLVHSIDAAISRQPQLDLATRQSSLWRVDVEVRFLRFAVPLTWAGYALSSVDASSRALIWAEDLLEAADRRERVVDPLHLQVVVVVDVLQVGV